MDDSVTSLDASWRPLRDLVNSALARYVAPQVDCPSRLQEAMAYSLLAGGKRMRPVLVLLASEACGGTAEAALPAACALEMVHTYSLIHDDLPAMDDDDLRRGRPTNHVVFGEGMAILAGDGLLTLAFEVMADGVQPPDVAAACCLDLARAAGLAGMVGGQVADLEAEETPVASVAELERIHRRKTGRLLGSALTLGGRIARADAATLTLLQHYGECIGLAFQIADDLLDVRGTAAVMGKGVRKDAAHGKATYPALLGTTASLQRAQSLVEDACQAIAPLGERGKRLAALAHFVLERDH